VRISILLTHLVVFISGCLSMCGCEPLGGPDSILISIGQDSIGLSSIGVCEVTFLDEGNQIHAFVPCRKAWCERIISLMAGCLLDDPGREPSLEMVQARDGPGVFRYSGTIRGVKFSGVVSGMDCRVDGLFGLAFDEMAVASGVSLCKAIRMFERSKGISQMNFGLACDRMSSAVRMLDVWTEAYSIRGKCGEYVRGFSAEMCWRELGLNSGLAYEKLCGKWDGCLAQANVKYVCSGNEIRVTRIFNIEADRNWR
jgi:hypothetical protein